MAAISVRGLNEDISARLKVRATRHGRSMEAEVHVILTEALADRKHARPNLAQVVRERFAGIDADELDIPARRDRPRAADLPE